VTVTGTVIISAPAPSGGATVTVSSDNPAVAQVPATVTIPAGSDRTTFPITTSGVSNNTSVVIRATVNGLTWAITLRLYPPTIATLFFTPNPQFGGSMATGTLALRGSAPKGGVVATLSSDNTALAQVPATVD